MWTGLERVELLDDVLVLGLVPECLHLLRVGDAHVDALRAVRELLHRLEALLAVAACKWNKIDFID